MKVVAVGGGHGTAVSLRALKLIAEDVTGVVSVADDGGSSGRLRAMLNVAAVGDLRKCLVALADPDNPLTASFEHRFSVGELSGHAVGNLLLVGLLDATGNLEESVAALAQLMGVKGTIVPASSEGVVLVGHDRRGTHAGPEPSRQLLDHSSREPGAGQPGRADRSRGDDRARRRHLDWAGLALHQRAGGLRSPGHHSSVGRLAGEEDLRGQPSRPRSPRRRAFDWATTSRRSFDTGSSRTWC